MTIKYKKIFKTSNAQIAYFKSLYKIFTFEHVTIVLNIKNTVYINGCLN